MSICSPVPHARAVDRVARATAKPSRPRAERWMDTIPGLPTQPPRCPPSYGYGENLLSTEGSVVDKAQFSKGMTQFYKAAGVELAAEIPGWRQAVRFNPGGPAVWGETGLKGYVGDTPRIEAYDTHMGLLVRQWDGRNSGANYYVQSLAEFLALVPRLLGQPFRRV